MLSHGIHTRRRRLTLAALAVALLSVLWVATPAFAHDELVGTDPASGAAVDALPAQLTLTFSGELIAQEGATAVEVTDAAGASLADGAPVIQANVVTQTLTGEASGAIRVLWKVVSSDGHPISGEYSFTVNAPAPTTTPTETPTPSAEPTPDEQPTESATPTPTPAGSEGSIDSGVPWVVGGLLVFGIAAAVAYLIISRRRREKALAAGAPTAPDAGSDTPSER